MKAKAPKKPGIYHSRWRLRDYSKAWGKKSHGFGPKLDLSLKVIQCTQPKNECGCRVWCSNGKTHKLAADIVSAAECKSVAKTFCSPNKVVSQSFQACSVPDSGPTSSPSGPAGDDVGGAGQGGASSTDPSSSGGNAGSGSTDPQTSDEGDEGDDNGYDLGDSEDDPDTLPVEDDPDFTDDGFDGNDEAHPDLGSADGGCSLSPQHRRPNLPLFALALMGLGAAVGLRRRTRKGARS
jgi:MYXO-CTERM domain-containing protein